MLLFTKLKLNMFDKLGFANFIAIRNEEEMQDTIAHIEEQHFIAIIFTKGDILDNAKMYHPTAIAVIAPIKYLIIKE